MAAVACPNCGEPAPGAYCPACGQSTDVDPRTLGGLLRGVFEDVLSIDGKLPRSLFALVFKPGKLTAEWRAGRRAAWSHPFRLYLVCSLAFFTASLVLPIDLNFSVGTEFSSDPAIRSAEGEAQQRALATVAPQTLILVIPVLALLLKLAFGKSALYVEHLIHATHLQSFLFVALFGVFAVGVLPGATGALFLVGVLGVFFGYVVFSCHRVYAIGPIRTFLVTTGVFILFLIGSLALLGGAVVVFQADPVEELRAAEARYADLRAQAAAGDTAGLARGATRTVVSFRRLESYLLGPDQRAMVAELLLWADSAGPARTMAEQGLVAAPAHAGLLRVAADAANALGDTLGATELRRRLERGPDSTGAGGEADPSG